jgi:hypothetical protein
VTRAHLQYFVTTLKIVTGGFAVYQPLIASTKKTLRMTPLTWIDLNNKIALIGGNLGHSWLLFLSFVKVSHMEFSLMMKYILPASYLPIFDPILIAEQI